MKKEPIRYEEQVQKLAELLRSSERIVFFGGAGTSTESGIPDFRSAGGVFKGEEGKVPYPYPPEVMVSRSFFYQNTEMFYTFYRDKLIHPEAKPNPGHQVLAKLEEEGRLQAVITQNIDGLHQLAGSREVIELHGSIHRNDCLSCRARYDLSTVLHSSTNIPACPACGGMLKPDVVLYEEALHEEDIASAIHHVQAADLLIIGGTSLSVQPAASFVQMGRGARIVLMNRTETSMDWQAEAIFREPLGKLLADAYLALKR